MIAYKFPSGDLALVNGTTRQISGVEYTIQKIEKHLKLFLGEWFLDLRKGVPYYRDILLKNPDLEVVRSVMRSKILEVEGIISVPVCTVVLPELGDNSRVATIEWEAIYSENDQRLLVSRRTEIAL
jgi:hypothetical protein